MLLYDFMWWWGLNPGPCCGASSSLPLSYQLQWFCFLAWLIDFYNSYAIYYNWLVRKLAELASNSKSQQLCCGLQNPQEVKLKQTALLSSPSASVDLVLARSFILASPQVIGMLPEQGPHSDKCWPGKSFHWNWKQNYNSTNTIILI